jgi:hypothetical protein
MTHRRALPIPPRVGSMGVFWVPRGLSRSMAEICWRRNFSKIFPIWVFFCHVHILSYSIYWIYLTPGWQKIWVIYQYGIIWTYWWKYHVLTLRRQWKQWELYCRGIQLYIPNERTFQPTESSKQELCDGDIWLNHQIAKYCYFVFRRPSTINGNMINSLINQR